MSGDEPVLPTYDELELRDGLHCSWGLWGDDDHFGTLNLLSPGRVLAAAAEIKSGQLFPLDL